MTAFRPNRLDIRRRIYGLVSKERARQDEKFGWIDSPLSILPGTNEWKKLAVVVEEIGEVSTALLEGDPIEHLHEELIQVAACCVAWVEGDIERQVAAEMRADATASLIKGMRLPDGPPSVPVVV